MLGGVNSIEAIRSTGKKAVAVPWKEAMELKGKVSETPTGDLKKSKEELIRGLREHSREWQR